ncbi:TetR family transcriptional regulator [Actinoallomurus sp. CA-150999]|uniref:TetR family transcriptional regulator n=1 Tax=Actinoallomurus sp. CA-150999 TaxID=3239887 RepID=UPI003D92EBEF
MSDGELARRRILDAAHAEFAARGYRAATVDAIARSSELSRAGVQSSARNRAGSPRASSANSPPSPPRRIPRSSSGT